MEKSKVMKAAWNIARTAANRFGGSSKQYVSEAMKMAWFQVKNEELFIAMKLVNATDIKRIVAATGKSGLDAAKSISESFKSTGQKFYRSTIAGWISKESRKLELQEM